MVRNRKVGEKMSIAKTGAIPNSYRQVHIAVDDFEKRILKGRIYHESRFGNIRFVADDSHETFHLGRAVQHGIIHVDVDDRRSCLDLFPGDRGSLRVILFPDKTGKFSGACHVCTFADIDKIV